MQSLWVTILFSGVLGSDHAFVTCFVFPVLNGPQDLNSPENKYLGSCNWHTISLAQLLISAQCKSLCKHYVNQ